MTQTPCKFDRNPKESQTWKKHRNSFQDVLEDSLRFLERFSWLYNVLASSSFIKDLEDFGTLQKTEQEKL